ncbi:MAG: hypothetical protein IJ083_11025 [Clostridia bacterium]|nr:hypothetical protein [Clostridia bacterium]
MKDRTARLAAVAELSFSPLSLFFLYVLRECEEKEDLFIAHFARQSVGLTVLHLIFGLGALALRSLLSPIPYVGIVTETISWLIYLSALLLILLSRIQLMTGAWNGQKSEVQMLGAFFSRHIRWPVHSGAPIEQGMAGE